MFPTRLILALLLSSTAVAQTPAWCNAPRRPEFATLQRVPVTSTWFEVYSVAPAVFAITEPRQSQHAISYLIVGTTRAALFDTGMGIGDLRKVTSELTPLPILVFNSHTHHDHVGSNWQFVNIAGMDTDFTRHNAQGSREDAQAEITPGQYCGELPDGFDPKAYETRAWEIKSYHSDGARTDLGGRTIEILATPGRTPDSICLLDCSNGLLFTGDTFYPGTVWLWRAETDLTAYAASIKRLAALTPGLKLVLGAHGVPVAQPSILPKLVSAFDAVQSGKITPTISGERARYKVDDISFLLHATN